MFMDLFDFYDVKEENSYPELTLFRSANAGFGCPNERERIFLTRRRRVAKASVDTPDQECKLQLARAN